MVIGAKGALWRATENGGRIGDASINKLIGAVIQGRLGGCITLKESHEKESQDEKGEFLHRGTSGNLDGVAEIPLWGFRKSTIVTILIVLLF